MAAIARRTVDSAAYPSAQVAEVWRTVAAQTVAWSSETGVALRDVVVLVPFVQLLPLARLALADIGSWMPRVETTRSLAATLGPPERIVAGSPSLDAALDRMQARQMLARQGWAATWRRRDPRGFERAAARLVATSRAIQSRCLVGQRARILAPRRWSGSARACAPGPAARRKDS